MTLYLIAAGLSGVCVWVCVNPDLWMENSRVMVASAKYTTLRLLRYTISVTKHLLYLGWS